jgi:sugar phosphate isomerase/epimerase
VLGIEREFFSNQQRLSWRAAVVKFNRRDFINCAAIMSASAATGVTIGGATTRALGQTPIKRVGPARLKISLNAYCFNVPLLEAAKSPGQGTSLSEVLDYCAEQNFDAIDPTGYYFAGYPKPPADAQLADFKRRAFTLGLEISGTGVRNDFTQADKEARAADVQMVKQWVEVAARMGAPVLRVFSGKEIAGQPFDETAKVLVDELQKCVEHGKKYGVVIGIQNHGDALKTPEQVLQIVKMINSEWFGVVVDTGNLSNGGDPYDNIAKLAPFAVNWQIKEKLDGREGNQKLDLVKVLRIVKDSGYRGYLPIETLSPAGKPYDPRKTVAEFLREVRDAMQQVG